MSARRTIAVNTAALYALQVANYLFPLVVMPYLLRAIGVAAFGDIAFVGSVVLALGAVVEFSFNYTATARIATNAGDMDAVSRIYSVVMVAKFVLMAACSVALLVITLAVPALRDDWPLAVAQWPLLLGEALFPMWLFQGVQKLTFVTTFHLVSRVATLALIFVFVHTPDDAAVAAGIQAIHLVIAGVVAQITAHAALGVRFRWPGRGEHRDLLHESAKVFVGNLGGHVYVRSPMMIVGLLSSGQLLGAYAIAHKVFTLLTSLVGPIAQSLYPYLCSIAEKNAPQLARLRRLSIVGVGATLTVGAIALNLLGDWVVVVLSGQPDPAVRAMLLCFSPAIVLVGVNTVLGKFVMALRRYDEFRRMFVISAVAFVIVCIPLTAVLDAYGTIAATIAVEALVLVQCLRISKLSPMVPSRS